MQCQAAPTSQAGGRLYRAKLAANEEVSSTPIQPRSSAGAPCQRRHSRLTVRPRQGGDHGHVLGLRGCKARRHKGADRSRLTVPRSGHAGSTQDLKTCTAACQAEHPLDGIGLSPASIPPCISWSRPLLTSTTTTADAAAYASSCPSCRLAAPRLPLPGGPGKCARQSTGATACMAAARLRRPARRGTSLSRGRRAGSPWNAAADSSIKARQRGVWEAAQGRSRSVGSGWRLQRQGAQPDWPAAALGSKTLLASRKDDLKQHAGPKLALASPFGSQGLSTALLPTFWRPTPIPIRS